MPPFYFLSVLLFSSIFPFVSTFVKKEDLIPANIIFLLIFLVLIGCLACNNLNISIKSTYYWLIMCCYPFMGIIALFKISKTSNVSLKSDKMNEQSNK